LSPVAHNWKDSSSCGSNEEDKGERKATNGSPSEGNPEFTRAVLIGKVVTRKIASCLKRTLFDRGEKKA
jgi:hypothetical protein